MLQIETDFHLQLFSSDQVPPTERFDVWRDLVNRKLLRSSSDRLADGPYQVKAALRLLPTLRVGVASLSPTIQHRPRGALCDENEDVALLVNLDGSFLVRRRGEDVKLGQGDGIVIRCREAGAYVMTDAGRHLVIRLGPEAMGAAYVRADRAVGSFLPAGSEAMRLLTPYALALTHGVARFSPAATQMVTEHISDLVALAVGARGEVGEAARERGMAAARLGAAMTYAREHLGDPNLSETAAAVHQGVSPRYLRRVFAASGGSFSMFVLEQRLSRSFVMLTNPRFARKTISDIAFDVGFGDLSYFNRAFRRRFERTPRDVRAEATQSFRMAAE